MTTVVLESTPHEAQDWLHSSLPLTLRLPIDGKPIRCKQEAADSAMTAECTNGMVQLAKPTGMIADVDRTPTLGGEPAARDCGVDEGDETEHEPQSRLQQTTFYCKEAHQRSGNTNENIPNAYGLPLKGEWEVCASGEARDPRSSANVPNATPECVHCPSESSETEDAEGVESEGCEGGTDELTELLTMSVEPYVEDGEPSACVHLGGTRVRIDDANSLGCRTDESSGKADMSQGLTDGSGAQMDAPSAPNKAETTGISHRDDAGTYLRVADAKRPVYETDGAGTHMGTLTGQTDASSVETNTVIPANVLENVRSSRKKAKPPDLPVEASRQRPDEPDGCGNHADVSSTRTDSHCIGNGTETAENDSGNVSKCQTEAQTRNSPHTLEIKSCKRARLWRKVSVDNGDVYVPWNVPVEALSRTFAFGEAESGDEVIAPDIEGKTAEGNSDGDGDQYGDDGDGDGITSSGSVDSIRVNAALLAVESQYMRQDRRTRNGNLPMLSRPPIRHLNRPYRLVMHLHRCGRLKIESINVSIAQGGETAYLEHARVAQPPANISKRCYGVIGPKRQHDRMKIEPARLKIKRLNDKKQQNGEITYLGRTEIAQPPANDAKRLNKAVGPGPRRDWMKIEPVNLRTKRINDKKVQRDETTYLECASAAQPP